jgi:endonuclease YncB( thermonuclease family)
MKTSSIFLTLIVLLLAAGCAPAAPVIVPVDTAVAQTMAALPRTHTPIPPPTETLQPSETPPIHTAIPEIQVDIAGVQCLPADSERTRGLVTRVIDGDTIEVAIGSGVYAVRYLGIDAPASGASVEWYGPQATGANREMVAGKTVVLVKDVSDTDSDGRLLRYVLSDQEFVNYEMVRLGFALVSASPPDLACQSIFLSLETEARNAMSGLWSPTATPEATDTPTPTATPEYTPTPTLFPACDCEGPKLSCKVFSRQSSAQACFEYCKATGYGDIFNMVYNNIGNACEGLP